VELDTSSFVADPDLIAALDTRSEPFLCDHNKVLFRQGELPLGLFIVHKKGDAELTMESASGEVVMRVESQAGSLLGLPGLIGSEPYTLSATGRKGAKIGFVKRIDFFDLMQAEPLLSVKILQVLAAEVRSARQALLQM
jgi:CRP-like cAMP-binding protein